MDEESKITELLDSYEEELWEDRARRARRIWKSSWYQRLILILGLLALGTATAVFAYTKDAVNPDYVAEEYFGMFVSGNYDAMLEQNRLTGEGLLSPEVWKEKLAAERTGQITDFEIKKKESTQEGYRYYFSYIEEGKTESEEFIVELEETGERQYHFFPVYRIKTPDEVTRDIEIQVPAGMEVLLEGIDIGAYRAEDAGETENPYDIYQIPALYSGEYVLTLTGPYTEEIQETLTVREDGLRHASAEPQVQPQFVEAVQNEMTEALRYVYQEAFEIGDGVEEFYPLFAESFAGVTGGTWKKFYSAVSATLYEGETGMQITQMTVEEETSLLDSYQYPNTLVVTAGITYSYEGVAESVVGEEFNQYYRGRNTCSATITVSLREDGSYRATRLVYSLEALEPAVEYDPEEEEEENQE